MPPLSGLTTTAKAVYAVLLWQSAGRPVIIVVDGNKQAEDLSEAVNSFLQPAGGGRSLRPATPSSSGCSAHAEPLAPRRNLRAAGHRPVEPGHASGRRSPILPVASALLRIEPADYYRQLTLRLRAGEELPLDEVVAHLESIGYQRREPVEMVGEYSVRGGILDVFSPESQKPVRIDLFGDQVESIRRFDVESQRSVLNVEDCLLLPLTEYQKSRPFLSAVARPDAGGRHPRPRSAAPGRGVSGVGTGGADAAAAQRVGLLPDGAAGGDLG